MRTFVLHSLCLMMALLATARIVADTVTQDGVSYTLNADNSGYTLTSGKGLTVTDLVIPNEINGLPVTEIGDNAFNAYQGFNGNLFTVTIPANVTRMGENAFTYCTKLTTVTFEKGSKLKSMGDRCLAQCFQLSEITIPASVETIGHSAFNGCHTLKRVIFENDSQLKSIGNWCFQFTEAMTEMNLEACQQLQTLGDCTLYFISDTEWGSNRVETLVLPSTLTSIGENCFASLKQMKALVFLGKKNWSDYTVGSYPFFNSKGTVYYNRDYVFPEFFSGGTDQEPYSIKTAGVENPVGLANVGDAKYATYALHTATVDYGKVAGLSAYKATYNSSRSTITLTPVTTVAKDEAVVLKADTAGYYVLTGAEDEGTKSSDNDLKISDGTVSGDGTTIWVLANKDEGVGFYPLAEGVAVPYGKAYLQIDGGTAAKYLPFENTPTAISSIKVNDDAGKQYFNLSGQRVTRNYRGIIVTKNGKYINK